MFSKGSEKLESLIGVNSEFQGEVNVKGTVRVDGRIEGQVNADCVILSDTAFIKGTITARKIIVGGKVEGNLRAREIVEIKSKGKIWGEILTCKFTVTEGGEFNGKVEMKIDEKEILNFDSKETETLDLHFDASRGL